MRPHSANTIPHKTLAELADLVGGTVAGDGRVLISGVAGIREAKPGEVTFVANPKYAAEIAATGASAVIVGQDVDAGRIPNGLPVLRVDDPYLTFVDVLEVFAVRNRRSQIGVHPSAVVGENVDIGERVSIQAHAVIADGVTIGSGTTVGPLVFIGDDTRIGSDCLLYPNVTIREEVTVGDRVIVHSGAVIGSDGFGFAKVSDSHRKIPQIGTVIVEDDVEIGANTTVDRATMTDGATVIGRGTKIDNLVQIAHNVRVGENCLIVSLVGLGGSTELEHNVTLAGQAGTAGHLRIGANTTIAAKAGVTKDVPANVFYSGYPATDHATDLKQQAAARRVPELIHQMRELQARVEELERDREPTAQSDT